MTESTAGPSMTPGRIDIGKINLKITAFRFVGRETDDMGMR
jgi:hypothetical protein